MFKQLFICLLCACIGTGSMLAQEPVHGVKTFVGTLKSGIIAIGSETTGTVLKTKDGGQIELDLGKSVDLEKLAGDLNGKDVIVTGEFTAIHGTEIKERQVLSVQSLKAAQ